MTFKPKKNQIHVPGFGVVQKEDFDQKHYNALMKRAGSNRDAFIKQHLVVDSYDDQPLFQDDADKQPEPEEALEVSSPKGKGKGKKSQKEKEENSTGSDE